MMRAQLHTACGATRDNQAVSDPPPPYYYVNMIGRRSAISTYYTPMGSDDMSKEVTVTRRTFTLDGVYRGRDKQFAVYVEDLV